MVRASRFVDGITVKVRLLVSTIVGAVAISWWAGINGFLHGLVTNARQLVLGPIQTYYVVVDTALGTPGEMISAAWAETARWFAVLEALGPWAYPVAVIWLVIVLYTVEIGVRKMGVIS